LPSVSPLAPAIVAFTRHAERRLRERGIAPGDVADVVLTRHHRRRRNPGAADWLVAGQGIAVAYNWPDEGDETTALVLSAWRQ
jgi:hypothetical protein